MQIQQFNMLSDIEELNCTDPSNEIQKLSNELTETIALMKKLRKTSQLVQRKIAIKHEKGR